MTWLMENLGSLLVGALLLAVVAAVVRRMLKDHREGRSSCGSGCASCPMSASCHRGSASPR